MPREKKAKPVSRKKQIRLEMIDQLRTALPALESVLGSKEFESRIEKAAKLLTDGIKQKKEKTSAEKKSAKKKPPLKLENPA